MRAWCRTVVAKCVAGPLMLELTVHTNVLIFAMLDLVHRVQGPFHLIALVGKRTGGLSAGKNSCVRGFVRNL